MDHRLPNHPWTILAVLGLLTAALCVGGCADYAMSEGARAPDAADDDDDWWDDDDAGDDDDAADDDDTGPPEDENDFISVPPAPGDVFVFIVNPNRDSVSKVNVETRQITTIDVGDEPSQASVTPDYTRAVVFNDGDDSVSVIDVQTDEVRTVDVREDFNFLEMSPTGEHAVCFLNTALLEPGDTFDGVLSYTEVSIVDLDALVSHDFSVGFNPRQVKFAADGELAVIISDEFITVVDLTVAAPVPELIDLEADPFDPPTAAEVAVEPSGEFAFIRYHDEDAIQVVDLDTGDLLWLYAGSDPTDMDLSPSGTEVVVVSRTSREVRTFAATDPEQAPALLELPTSETIGSLSMAPIGDMAVLYTSAFLTDRVTVWDRATDELTIRRLEKPVEQMVMAPDGDSMIAVHTEADVEGEDDLYSDHFVITIITLGGGTFVPNAVLLEDPLTSLANFDAGDKAVFMMEDNRNVGVIDYGSRLVDDVVVPSYPVHVGTMPAEPQLPPPVAWVSQDHPLGRISFIDPDTLEVQTVTGFELNSGIE